MPVFSPVACATAAASAGDAVHQHGAAYGSEAWQEKEALVWRCDAFVFEMVSLPLLVLGLMNVTHGFELCIPRDSWVCCCCGYGCSCCPVKSHYCTCGERCRRPHSSSSGSNTSSCGCNSSISRSSSSSCGAVTTSSLTLLLRKHAQHANGSSGSCSGMPYQWLQNGPVASDHDTAVAAAAVALPLQLPCGYAFCNKAHRRQCANWPKYTCLSDCHQTSFYFTCHLYSTPE